MSGYCWFVLEAWFVLEGGIWPKGGPYGAHNSESNFSRLIIRFIVGFVLGGGLITLSLMDWVVNRVTFVIRLGR